MYDNSLKALLRYDPEFNATFIAVNVPEISPNEVSLKCHISGRKKLTVVTAIDTDSEPN